MSDGRKPGCYLSILIVHSKTGNNAFKWMSLESGLSQEYIDKILSVKIINRCWFKVKFDSTANCFEAIQQIIGGDDSRDEVNYRELCVVTCPRGHFRKTRLSLDFENPDLEPTIKDLEKLGFEILETKRLKDYGVATGEVELVLFSQKYVDAKDMPSKVSATYDYIPKRISRLSEETVNNLWKKYGPSEDKSDLAVVISEERKPDLFINNHFCMKTVTSIIQFYVLYFMNKMMYGSLFEIMPIISFMFTFLLLIIFILFLI